MRPSTSPTASFRTRFLSLAMLGVAAVVLTGCETDGSGPGPLASLSSKPAEPAKPAEPPMTHSRAASQCWMMTEKGHADANLDKRADIVTKCIDDKMKKAAEAPKT